jgi:DNA (cytosine-5)-methyltransferase 1
MPLYNNGSYLCRRFDKMAISYNKLWKLLIDKGIKKTELKTLAGVSSNVIAKLGKNDHVSMETLAKICTALNCDIADIVEMTGDTGKEDCE